MSSLIFANLQKHCHVLVVILECFLLLCASVAYYYEVIFNDLDVWHPLHQFVHLTLKYH